MNELDLDAGTIWLIAAILLGTAELLIPGVFLIFLAVAAAIVCLATFALPDLSLTAQLLAFAIWSVVTVVIGRRWYRDYPIDSTDELLNDRMTRMIGGTATVESAIENGCGRVHVGDSSWSANGPDIAVGTVVQIIDHRDGSLLVEPLTDSTRNEPPNVRSETGRSD